MQYNYLVFVNPHGKRVTPKKVRRLQDIFNLGSGKIDGKFVVTETLSQLEKAVAEHKNAFQEYCLEDRGIVGIVGGDGTIMRTRTFVENIWECQPIYAFFPEGTMNNSHAAAGVCCSEASMKLAKHLVGTACTDTLDNYILKFPSLDLNGHKGFNIGFGLISKLLWMYNGNSAKQYRELEESLQNSPKENYKKNYKKIYEQITGKKETDFFSLLPKERGRWGVIKTALQLLNSFRAHTEESYLLHKPLSGEIIFDEEPQSFQKQPLGIYISCYDKVNLGLSRLNPSLLPEVRTEEDRFQAAVPYGSLFSIIAQLPKCLSGQKLSGVLYRSASSLRLDSEKFAQVDGELLLDDGFTVNYDGKRKIITLPLIL